MGVAAAMRFPWQREQIDVEALVSRVAGEAASRAVAEAHAEIRETRVRVAELSDVLRANGDGMMPIPPTGNLAASPYPIYARDQPFRYMVPQAPYRKPESPVTVDMLRSLAESFDILRACISHLQRELVNVPIQIVPKDDADQSDETQARVRAATEWFEEDGGVGGLGMRRGLFEAQVVEDLEVVGAAALYFSPTRGGGVYEVLAIDAATIRPHVDAYGWPGPGEDVYEQWIYGVKVAGFTREELLYDGIHARTWTPYFASPVEWLVARILTALKVDEWDRTWLTDGAMPSDMIALPDGWTPAQVREYAEWFVSLLRGDSRARQQPKFVPSGTSTIKNATRKDHDFAEFKNWLVSCTCAVMGVHRASIGFEGEQYKVSQENSMAATSEFGVSALLEFRRSLYNRILRRLGYTELECRNVTAEEEEAGTRATRNAALVMSGIKTPNEARADEGLDAMPGGEMLFIPATLVPLDQALAPPAPPPVGGTSPEFPDNSNVSNSSNSFESSDESRRAALSLWEKKAVARLNRGEPAQVNFRHWAIDEEERNRVRDGLDACRTPADVRALFATILLEMPPVYHTTVEQHERQRIARAWRDRRIAAEREEAAVS